MRLLRINDYTIDLDDKTVIGVDVQGLDLTKPSKRMVNQSNSFSIPNTINNLKAIGYLGGFQNISDSLYSNYSVEYSINNEIAISGSYATIQKIDKDRISLQVVSKYTLWDDMKSLGWNDFSDEYFDYIVANHNIPDVSNPINETFTQWVNRWLDVSDGALRLHPTYSNESDFLGLDYLSPRTGVFQMLYYDTTLLQLFLGGHWWSDVRTLFLFIENYYSVDFDISGGHEDNPFLNSEFSKTIFNIRNYSTGKMSDTSWYVNGGSGTDKFLMENDVEEDGNLNLYGLVFSILNIWGVVIEDIGRGKYRLRDINYDIANKRPIKSSLKLDGDEKNVPKITPLIKGYGQESIIKYTDYSDGINSVGTRKIVECNNKNIQFRKDIIKIENFIPAVKDNLLNYAVDNSFKQYKIATWEEENNTYGWILTVGAINNSATISKSNYKKVIPIDLSDKWGLLDEALTDPLYVEQKVWLTPTQYSKINNWTLYYIPELAGSYYINRVKGYNPEKSLQSVTLELIRINTKTPE